MSRVADAGDGRQPGDGRLAGFAPVVDVHCRLLILGSFPGRASLVAGHYYAHPRNQFWPILASVLGQPLTTLPFEARYQTLLAHGIGLWDAIAACDRPGSLDADVRRIQAASLVSLGQGLPRLRQVLLNGRLAWQQASRQPWPPGVTLVALPSTSPAHAMMRFDEKLASWRTALLAPGMDEARSADQQQQGGLDGPT
ncbi:MAG: DNA-deoxyinosine glycosylase [Burkholderiaceae bacterium]